MDAKSENRFIAQARRTEMRHENGAASRSDETARFALRLCILCGPGGCGSGEACGVLVFVPGDKAEQVAVGHCLEDFWRGENERTALAADKMIKKTTKVQLAMPSFDQGNSDQLDKLIYSDPVSGLKQLRELARIYSGDTFFQKNYGSRLLDIGGDLQDPQVISEGISETEKIINKLPDDERFGIEINLATAHRKLHGLDKSKTSIFDRIDSDELSMAKRMFNALKKKENTVSQTSRKRFLIEFGICLSDMGRFYEATRLYEHALQITPNDPVATANLALVFREIAWIADDVEVLREASAICDRALATNELDKEGGIGTAKRIEEFKKNIDAMLARCAEAPGKPVAIVPNSYQDFCKKSQLFLNFCFHTHECPHSPEDSAMFAVAGVKDENRLIKWVRTVNEIKQQFAVARLLLFDAFRDPGKMEPTDKLTSYFDLNDQSVYGIRSGKMKVGYVSIFNLFDKVGFFLNDYLQLGIADKDVSFRGIWKDRKGQIWPQIVSGSNIYLRALYEVSKELPDAEHFGMFTEIRNLLTHRYFVLHARSGDWRSASDSDKYHGGYKEFSWLTLQLLGLAKAAITYLSAFVRSREIQQSTMQIQFVRPIRYNRGDSGPGTAEI